MATNEWRRISVTVGGTDLTAYLYNREQTATLPDGPEIGRASLTLRYNPEIDGIEIDDWDEVVITTGGTVANVTVWGGYVTRRTYEPVSEAGGGYAIVTLDCQSYALRLVTTEPIDTSYDVSISGISDDADIVDDLVSTYAPYFYDATKIGGASVVLDYISFAGDNLRQALQKVTNITRKEYGVTPAKKFYYRDFGGGTTYAYQLSDSPDEVTTYPMRGEPIWDVDAVDRRNKIRVIGGWTYSDIVDDSFSGTGAQTNFVLTYKPAVVINITVSGVDQTVGVDFVDDPADFDVLVNYDTKTIKFTAAPGSLAPIHCYYRYNVRPDVTVADAASITAMGGTIWAPTLRDDSISGTADATAAGSAYLSQYGTTLYRGQVTTVHSGTAGGTIVPWQPGGNVLISVDAWGLSGATTMTIKGVTMRAEPRPGGAGYCLVHWDLDLGGRMTVGQTIAGEARNVDVTNQATPPTLMGGLSGHGPGE